MGGDGTITEGLEGNRKAASLGKQPVSNEKRVGKSKEKETVWGESRIGGEQAHN